MCQRRVVVSIVAALLSLSSAACHVTSEPSPLLRGTWAEVLTVPGASYIITLDQSGVQLTGSGTYTIEAGRQGTLQVVGTYSPPTVALTISSDAGDRRTFVGTLIGGDQLRGAFDGSSSLVTFARR